MNNILLLGHLVAPPAYFCTEQGRDLTRLQLLTPVTSGLEGEAAIHHCRAWGPAALDLHQHLEPGDRLLVRGELLYRQRKLSTGKLINVPVIQIKSYSYLGR